MLRISSAENPESRVSCGRELRDCPPEFHTGAPSCRLRAQGGGMAVQALEARTSQPQVQTARRS